MRVHPPSMTATFVCLHFFQISLKLRWQLQLLTAHSSANHSRFWLELLEHGPNSSLPVSQTVCHVLVAGQRRAPASPAVSDARCMGMTKHAQRAGHRASSQPLTRNRCTTYLALCCCDWSSNRDITTPMAMSKKLFDGCSALEAVLGCDTNA